MCLMFADVLKHVDTACCGICLLVFVLYMYVNSNCHRFQIISKPHPRQFPLYSKFGNPSSTPSC